jgi:hypothetical protein
MFGTALRLAGRIHSADWISKHGQNQGCQYNETRVTRRDYDTLMALLQSGIRRRVVWRNDTDVWKNLLSTSRMASSTTKTEAAASSKTRLHGVTTHKTANLTHFEITMLVFPSFLNMSLNVSSQLRGNCLYCDGCVRTERNAMGLKWDGASCSVLASIWFQGSCPLHAFKTGCSVRGATQT